MGLYKCVMRAAKLSLFKTAALKLRKAKRFCVRPSMEAAEEDEMDPAHFKFGVSKGDT